MKLLITTLITFLTTSLLADGNQFNAIKAQGGTGYRINDIRSYEVDENTEYKEDGDSVPSLKAQGGTGYKIRFAVSDLSPNFTTGTLDSIDLINIYKGPVVSKSPFKVFNVEGLVTGQTFFAQGLDINSINIGDEVKISGFIDDNSSSILTRIEKSDLLAEWKISGNVENLTNYQFLIGDQVIKYTPADVGACNASLANGDFVEVFAAPILNFQMNDHIDTVTEINCVDRRVMPLTDEGTVLIEGMIDSVDMNGDFILAGQDVDVSPGTMYVRGRSADIQERIKVIVEGTADDMTGLISADKVWFLEPRINLTLPVLVSEFNLPEINVAGVTLKVTPQTLDPDNVILNGITETTQLQFRGYDYGDSELYITRVNVRGSVDYNDIEIDGYVNQISDPNIEIFGVNYDTTGAVFIDENDQIITSTEFFNILLIGSKLMVEGAHLDDNTGIVSGGTITIDELDENEFASLPKAIFGGQSALGVGTITDVPDVIFQNSFE